MTTTVPTRTHNDVDTFALLRRLVELLLTWSYEGTLRSERIVKRVAERYAASVEVTFLADSALLTMGDRTVSLARAPTVPPLDQVADLKTLLLDVLEHDVPALEALARIDALQRRESVFSRVWQVVGLGLSATGFGSRCRRRARRSSLRPCWACSSA